MHSLVNNNCIQAFLIAVVLPAALYTVILGIISLNEKVEERYGTGVAFVTCVAVILGLAACVVAVLGG